LNTVRTWAIRLPLAALLWVQTVAAITVEELQAQGRLSINASLSPTERVVAGQKLALVIEIATDRWFTGGTRLTTPEIPGLVILQTEQFASNASETRGTQSWVIQRWTLDVYPQRPGNFTIPSIRARIQMNADESGDIEGDLFSPATRFSASLPPGLQPDQDWVASPTFSATQTFDRALEGLAVGDAFERELQFEASDVMAMMLPAFTPGTQPGLGIYPSPPELENTINRGEIRAVRRQRMSYVVEEEGEYRFPSEAFYWWNTARGELRLVSLEEIVFTVGSAAGAGEHDSDPARRQLILLVGAALLSLSAAALLVWRYVPRSLPSRLAGWLTTGRDRWRSWRSPALPAELNPGSNAGAQTASRPP
jgi:hypothetical protein